MKLISYFTQFPLPLLQHIYHKLLALITVLDSFSHFDRCKRLLCGKYNLNAAFCVAGALITAFFFGLNSAFHPYATESLNRTQASTLVSLFLNLFLGILLCLSRYMDLEKQQTCKNEIDNACSKWKSVERIVVEISVSIITLSVPVVPIFNAISPDITKENMLKIYNFIPSWFKCTGKEQDLDLTGKTFTDIMWKKTPKRSV
jgi:hypothetical protein